MAATRPAVREVQDSSLPAGVEVRGPAVADDVARVIAAGLATTTALDGSTEQAQF